MSNFKQFDISDFLNEIKEPLFLMDEEEIIFWNDYSRDHFVDLPLEWEAWFSKPELIDQIQKFFEDGEVPNSRYFKSLEYKDGTMRRFEWSFTNLPSTYNSRFLIVKANPIRYMGENTEENFLIDKNIQAVEELSYMQSILNNSHDLIAILDEKGNYKFISDSVGEKLGFPVEAIVGRNFNDFIQAGILQLVKGSFEEVLESDREVAVDFWINRQSGERIYLESFAKNLLHHPEINGVLFSSRDITDFIQMDRDLQKRYEIENLINQVSAHLINATLTQPEVEFQFLLEKFGQFLHAELGYIWILNRETDELELLNTWTSRVDSQQKFVEIQKEIQARKNRLEKGMIKLVDCPEGKEDGRVLLLIPMISINKLRGVLSYEIDKKKLEHNEKQLQIFRQLGDILAGAYAGSLLTRRIQRNESLLATTERLSKSGSWRYSTQKDLFYISGGLAELFGLGVEPLTCEFTALIYKIDKDTRSEFVKKLKKSIAEKSQESGEFTIQHPTGGTAYIFYEIETRENFLNQGMEVTGFCTDVTHKRAAEEHLRLQSQILAQVSDPIVVTDLDMQVIYLNEAAIQLCCPETAATFRGNVDDLLNCQLENGEKGISRLMKKVRDGNVWKGELSVETKHTRNSPFEISIKSIFSENQKRIGFSIILRSLTDKKESEKLAARARMIAENSPAVLFQVDPNDNYRIEFISENISQFGYQSADLMGKRVSFLELVHPADRESIIGLRDSRKTDSGILSFSGEYRIKTASGDYVWVEDKTSDVKDFEGHITFHQGIFQDITERKNFEQFKEEKEKQYRMLASQIPGTNIFLLDKNRQYILAEGTNFEHWGLSREDFEGKYLKDISLTDREEVSEILDRVYQDQEVVESEFEFKDRKYHRVIRPILENGQVEYALSIIRDVTEEYLAKKQLEESEEKYRTLVEESTEIIFSLTDTYVFEYISPNVKQFLGYEVEEVLGRSFFDFLYPDDLDVFQNMLNESQDFLSENQYLEFRLPHKNGEIRVFNSNGKIIWDKDGKRRLYTGIARDISKLKQAQKELVKAKENAEEASRIKSQFLSVMSHEIRTPMNAVIGLSHFLMEDDPRPDQLENLKTLQFSAENLMALINDILDYNKIDSGKIELEHLPLDLRHLLHRIVHSHSFQSHEKGLKISCEIDESIPQWVLADSVRMGQVINNLVSNAIKFTEKGFVKIGLQENGIDSEGRTRIQFRFEDTGIGIPKDKAERIFDAFTQASSDTTRKYGGTGLGLAIVKRLVELFGGEIHYYPNPSGGSIFEFEVPFEVYQKQLEVAQETTHVASRSLEGYAVLVAEDNAVNQVLIKKFLQKWNVGYLELAEDGRSALDKFEQDMFDILLLDLQMPNLDGFEVAKKIRSHSNAKKANIPILALTASSLEEVKNEMLEAGIDDYIPKPFSPEVLYEKLSKYLRSRSFLSD
ncbi:PAS domain S-box protein [Algoriphagus kandeliae]|uniref:histidine kinase n=1 Tax=Algoriphagus kandeliae TaxID=2562278 RepID=A0A4Y9R2M7_9BACT|nr:PAS domain S-box protein [Algoriphagus kandeliae]TFV97525.1 PAS domain S-box protein [Algoriphagus kandeliae]